MIEKPETQKAIVHREWYGKRILIMLRYTTNSVSYQAARRGKQEEQIFGSRKKEFDEKLSKEVQRFP